MVAIPSPPPSTQPNPVFVSMPKGARVTRLYNPHSHGATALQFRAFGPIGRFDHQRSPYPTGAIDTERGIMYGAYLLSSCLVEIFGDTKIIDVGTWEVASLQTCRSLNLLDLRGAGAMRAGTVSAIAKGSNRRISQEWSRYFYEHRFIYQEIDGICFYNAHNDEEAFAFYERAANGLQCSAGDTRILRHDSLRTAIQDIALRNGMVVEPY